MSTTVPLKTLVDEWLRLDQNPTTRAEVEMLWKDQNINELEKRLRTRIEFGTAGLRGRMEAGFARMNDLIIIQASQGLCAYVLSQVRDAITRGVVIGHDHRYHSGHWALLTAAAFIDRGVRVHLLDGLVHTPLVPYSVKKLGAACGVMITASHNPKDDNGYKVYWENAVQIIAPHDIGIAQSILENLTPKIWDTNSIASSNLCYPCTTEMRKAYMEDLFSIKAPLPSSIPSVKIVNTSMHGVSHPFVEEAFKKFGYPPFIPVKEQQEPNPAFPTVVFPNPEEKGALDLAIATATAHNAQYVLAQDPDSDRFSAAEKQSDGKWLIFTGDQLGSLFAHQVFEAYKATGKPLDRLAMVASTVSSKMVESMAHTEGFKFAECLTGFKYIGNTALQLVKEGYEVPFGYEEAIGFMFGPHIRDKDGVAATVTFVGMLLSLHSQGRTVFSYLQDLYQRYGFFQVFPFYTLFREVKKMAQTSNSYFICTDPNTINSIFRKIRDYDNGSYPKHIAGLGITRVVDLTTGYDSSNPPTFKPFLPLSSGHMVQFRASTEDKKLNIVLTIRTSGTEPKIKYYLEGSGPDSEAVKELLPRVVNELSDKWMEAGKNNLGRP